MNCTIEKAKEAAIRRKERERVVRILVDEGYCTEKLGTPCCDNCFACWVKNLLTKQVKQTHSGDNDHNNDLDQARGR